MKLILHQDVMSYTNFLYGKKGEVVLLISDSHYPVLLVMNFQEQTFSVRASGTNYQELKDKINE